MGQDYTPVTINEQLRSDLLALVKLARDEDLRGGPDWTSWITVGEVRRGRADVVARAPGVAAGVELIETILEPFDADIDVSLHLRDGQAFARGDSLATLSGNVRDLLTTERTVLNLLCRLCGIAALTARYVDSMGQTKCRLYDTRKTTPGMRLLEKYAVRCGGGHSHRTGLHDGILIKDNHLALAHGDKPMSTGEAVQIAKRLRGTQVEGRQTPSIIEIEVDTMQQFNNCLEFQPDIILLDNFRLEELRQAVSIRDSLESLTELEASGNVNLSTIADVAATGVDRISSGALTHQAQSLDLGLDWLG
ncbi:MAG: carboxylating nicotinate-nucleotide diphosphorylase [Planctomycetota bacterium]